MFIDVKTACKKLDAADNILIIAHQRPDGDTLGGAFALYRALFFKGKKARVFCADSLPLRYGYLYEGYIHDESFEPEFTVSVDVAALPLICNDYESFKGRIDLCIDHHKSHSIYAEYTLLDTGAAAACEIISDVVAGLGVEFTKPLADAIFTGITTDTGCFKYSNVTDKTHEIAADMIRKGANHLKINKLIFDTKSRGILMIEHMITETAKFHFDDRCCLIFLPKDVTERFGVTEDELDGIAAFPARIEGVSAGITVKESRDGSLRVSVRTSSPVDASKICMAFGGGGHTNAAGCTLNLGFEQAAEMLLEAVKKELE